MCVHSKRESSEVACISVCLYVHVNVKCAVWQDATTELDVCGYFNNICIYSSLYCLSLKMYKIKSFICACMCNMCASFFSFPFPR